MIRRIAYVLLATIALLLVAAQGASAATSAQIHRDAADGVIDGNYTTAELREADRTAPAELREYYGWEDAYRDALRRKANPEAPPTAAPVDSNRDGKIDSNEQAAAVEKTKEVRKKAKPKPAAADECASDDEAPECADSELEACEEDASSDECVDTDEDTVAAAAKDEDDDDGSPLIWLIIGLPVLIVAVGAWRMARGKKPGDGAPKQP